MEIILKIDNASYLPSRVLIEILQSVEDSIVELELENLEKLSKSSRDIPELLIEASKAIVKKKKGDHLQIKSAKSGSIILIGAVIGFGYWLLDKTLGETFKEAWLESNAHAKIKEALLKSIRFGGSDVKARVSNKLAKKGYKTTSEISEEAVNISISVPQDPEVERAISEQAAPKIKNQSAE